MTKECAHRWREQGKGGWVSRSIEVKVWDAGVLCSKCDEHRDTLVLHRDGYECERDRYGESRAKEALQRIDDELILHAAFDTIDLLRGERGLPRRERRCNFETDVLLKRKKGKVIPITLEPHD